MEDLVAHQSIQHACCCCLQVACVRDAAVQARAARQRAEAESENAHQVLEEVQVRRRIDGLQEELAGCEDAVTEFAQKAAEQESVASRLAGEGRAREAEAANAIARGLRAQASEVRRVFLCRCVRSIF